MWHNTMKRLAKRMASCHVGHTGTHLITKVKQQWARIVLGWDDKYDGVPASRGLGRLREDRERSYSAWVCEIYKHSSRKCFFLKNNICNQETLAAADPFLKLVSFGICEIKQSCLQFAVATNELQPDLSRGHLGPL
jgi:hypothetical protein